MEGTTNKLTTEFKHSVLGKKYVLLVKEHFYRASKSASKVLESFYIRKEVNEMLSKTGSTVTVVLTL